MVFHSPRRALDAIVKPPTGENRRIQNTYTRAGRAPNVSQNAAWLTRGSAINSHAIDG